ncbi:hypothetical protein HPB47_009887 [Ixodes persulcatus]|uniref:Uncharacterized protein n=1 Tax=Ixodes persulcatus TaxID=34615 RepID=A0AC60P0N9_IXOPE|nr:hypothetical protein HPB47_009887 [Ixodes persulcatus]
MAPTRILQWNCNTFSARAAELKLRFERNAPPEILLLQETKTPDMTITGFNVYLTPTIKSKPSYREKNPIEKKGWVAVCVL